MSVSNMEARRPKSPTNTDENAGVDPDVVEPIPEPEEEINRPLTAIEICKKNLQELDEWVEEQILQLKKKCFTLEPVYAKRAATIEKVPNFWRNAILYHPTLRELIDIDPKMDCLLYLRQLKVNKFQVTNGFQVVFSFEENPFFENSQLVRFVNYGSSLASQHCSTSEIKWLPNYDRFMLQENPFIYWFTSPTPGETDRMIADELWENPQWWSQEELDAVIHAKTAKNDGGRVPTFIDGDGDYEPRNDPQKKPNNDSDTTGLST